MTRKIILIVGLFALVASPSVLANKKSTLDRLIHKIASIKNLLVRDNDKREKLQNDLEKVETNSAEISKQLHITKKMLKKQDTLLTNLKMHQTQFEAKLRVQQALLEQQIVTAYMLGRQSYLKLLLNQENSSEVSRILMYYHFINKNRIHTILDMQNTLAKIQQNQEKIQSQYQTLKTLQLKQKNQQKQLTSERQNRLRLITILNKNIKSRKQRLDSLVSNKKRLEKTVERVGRSPVNFPKANFSRLHYSLHWPTQGKVLKIFGTKIEQSELRWGGVLIKAPEEQPIYAIANGKVVFAKWLSGYGLLLIINHGHGYMTLYGRNHVLYKNVGDTVRRGDLIATVGQTGGYQNPALYFAVRRNGKPINPTVFIGR